MPQNASPHDTEARQSVIDYCLEMNACGINQGTSGNISIRHGDGLLITPTSIPYEDLTPADIVFIDADGAAQGHRKPSSEWHFHYDILRNRPDMNAVIHTHPTYCTILAILGKPIPPLHYMIFVGGGIDIRCAPYALFGTPELSDLALKALDGRMACLLSHHGMIAIGATLKQTLWRAIEVETLAQQYHGCLQLGAEPPLLTEEQMAEVFAKVGTYGLSGTDT